MDLIEYLDSHSIDYISRGKNVMRGCVAVNCPICGDPSRHCNLSLSIPVAICLRCGKYSLAYILSNLEDLKYSEAKKLVSSLNFDESLGKRIDEKERESKLFLPGLNLLKMFKSEMTENLLSMHTKYLEKRGFDVEYLQYKFRILGSTQFGKYKFRIIFPVIMGGRIVSFTGRDISELAPLRYMNLDDNLSLVPRDSQLYNIDSVKEILVITEGPMDVCRFGSGAVATLSITYTSRQIAQIITHLLHRSIKRCFVIYDPGETSQNKARQIAQQLALLGNFEEVKRIDLGDSDLGDLTESDVAYLRKELFKSIF